MKLTIAIQGREAIPVRAIPFITGWHLSPDRFVEALAHKSRSGVQLAAFSFNEQGARVLPKHWDDCLEYLRLLNVANLCDMDYSDSQLQRLAVERIRSGVFVWKDELDAAYAEGGGPLAVQALRTDEVVRFGDDDYSHMPDELYQMVMEGFIDSMPPPMPSGPTEGVVETAATPVPLEETQSLIAPAVHSAPQAWVKTAKDMGKVYVEQWRADGKEPTVADVASYLEGEFSTRGIYGARGKVLDSGYITRSALTGITGRAKGYKSKKPKVPSGRRERLPEIK